MEAQDILKISARVVNDKTGEYLIGAVVYDTLSKNGTYTNEVGYFYLEMRKDAAIFISHIGYESIWLSANEQLKKNTLIRLIPNNNLIEGVEIISRRPKYEINKIYFTPLELKSTIILGGESDVLKSLTLTPGIKSGVEGTSNIYVRGGNSDQNLILIEGVPIYNTSHLFGLVSIFPNDQIQSVSTYKGSFPAKYGGRLSSVIDMRLKNGNTSKTERSFTLGILSSKANINGSLFEDRLRYNVFYRRNLFDVFSKLQSNQNGEPSIHFSDFNTKLTYQLGNSNFIQFFCLITDEIWKRNSNFNSGNTNNQSSTRYNWGNNIYQLRMYGSFLNKGSYDLNLYSYNYKSHLGSSSHLGVNSIDFKKEFLYSNSIRENTTKIDFKYPLSQKWEVSSGIELKDQTFLPGQTSIQQSIKEQVILDSNSIINQYKVLDTRIYFNNEYIWNKFSFNAGLNVNINKYLPSNFTLEPRIISLYKIKDNIGIHASFSRTTQNIFQLSNNSLGLPTDVWIGSNQGIPVSSALNYALGASMEHKMYALSVDVYYRKLDGMLRYNPGSNFLLNGVDWKNRLQLNGSGMTYGLETLIKKNSGRVTGWLAYT
ncbi:MAG: TonB-dependent receptor, partial [Saprospiraceae bacterium]